MQHMPFKNYFYDIDHFTKTQGPVDATRIKNCAMFELNYAECLEAYGSIKGKYLCAKFKDDFVECTHGGLREYRNKVLQEQRVKRYLKGESKQFRGPPLILNGHVDGTFYP